MNSNGRHCLHFRDAIHRARSASPFATYYVYYSARAETV